MNKRVVAFSYERFSRPEQATGDSIRRQTELRDRWLARHPEVVLDTTLTLRDLGVSAFRGKNAMVGNLGVFLAAVKRGTVPPGSILLVESFDRISRQGIDEGGDLIKSILKSGIKIVTLSPEREFDAGAVKSVGKGWIEILLILERAAEESERKSERLAAAWSEKRSRARKGEVMTNRLPAWVRRNGDRLELIPERAEVVREIFRLAGSGYGIPSILNKLIADGTPPFGRTGKWTRAYVNVILKDRRAVGEYQPRKAGKPDGPPVAYYPPAVSEDEFLAARAGMLSRRGKGKGVGSGRGGARRVNIFAGLLKTPDGDSYQMTQRLSRSGPNKPYKRFSVLITAKGAEATGEARSIPYDGFEGAILTCLRELDPADVLGEQAGPDPADATRKELDAVEVEYAKIQAIINAGGVSVAVNNRAAALEARRADLLARLVEQRAEAARPAGEALAEAKSLAAALKSAPDPDDARLRLRAALRRVVTDMRLLVVRCGRDRFCAVQMWFAGGCRRSYIVGHRTASRLSPGTWAILSWASRPGKPNRFDKYDLRDPEQAARYEQLLRYECPLELSLEPALETTP